MRPYFLKLPMVWLALMAGFICLAASGQEISSFSALADGNRASIRPLSQEQAFPFFVSEAGTNTLRVTWQSAPEHYLYKRAFKFSYYSSATAAAQDVAFSIPQGLAKTDEFFGEVEVYFDQLEVELDLPQSPSTDGFLIIEYQGCADWGFCYPPQRTRFEL